MPANMMKAPVGSKLNVRGRSSATVSAGPIPGSTPTSVPSVTPTDAKSRFSGVRAVPNPAARSPRTSMDVGGDLEDQSQDPGREPDAQELGEADVDDDADPEAGDDVADRRSAAQDACGEREEESGGDDVAQPGQVDRAEPEAVEGQGVADEHEADQPHGDPVAGALLLRPAPGEGGIGPDRGAQGEGGGEHEEDDRHDQRHGRGADELVPASARDAERRNDEHRAQRQQRDPRDARAQEPAAGDLAPGVALGGLLRRRHRLPRTMTSVDCVLPLRSRRRCSRPLSSSPAARAVASETSSSPVPAADARRAVTFTASPSAVNSTCSAVPTAPT